ncbi:hypothetical protein MBLNU457_4355t1 [Dothideomycetes sp. NU457]
MCYYDQHVFSCGDWKWGQFRLHCQHEYRTGETCGRKLVNQGILTSARCELCEKMDTKKRRREAEVERIRRWSKEPKRYSASLEKAVKTVHELDRELMTLDAERRRRLTDIGGRRR